MEPKTPPSASIYLRKTEVSMLLAGLNFSMEKHYGAYDADLPQELIELTSRLMEIQNQFKYCYDCKETWVKSWSSDTHTCLLDILVPAGEEE